MVDAVVKIELINREFLSSGSFIAENQEDHVSIRISDLKYKFVFKRDETGIQNVEGANQRGKEIDILFLNVDSPLGIQWSGQVGTLDNRKLHLTLMIHTINSGNYPRLINYMFTLGDAV